MAIENADEIVELVKVGAGNDGDNDGGDDNNEIVIGHGKRIPKRTGCKLLGLGFLGSFLFMAAVWLVLPREDGNDVPSGALLNDKQELVDRQVESFRQGTGLILNLHITHHGGTTVCSEFSLNLKHPSFSCMGATKEDPVDLSIYPNRRPWGYNETDWNIKYVTQFFQFISWEFAFPAPIDAYPQLKDANYEHQDLVSFIVMREPLSRALAADGTMSHKYPWWHVRDEGNITAEQWWQFAREEELHNNNFALRVLSNATCCDGADTSLDYLEQAKALVSRFTYVIDLACLGEGLTKLSKILGFELRNHTRSSRKYHHHKSISERIPYPEVVEYLQEKNKLDIELYQWSKSISLVNCQALEEEHQAAELAASNESPP